MNEPLPLNISIGDKYDPAMKMTDQAEADAYFERCVQHTMLWMIEDGRAKDFKEARPEAEKIERINLGYYAGYGTSETRARVERLFRCAHPYFGAIAQNGPPTTDAALVAGVRLATER
jgi:hypothetical protein